MKSRIKYIGFWILVLGLWACTKNVDDKGSQYHEDVQFFMDANIGGFPVEMRAGENGYFMSTSYDYTDEVVTVEGHLHQVGEPYKNAMVVRVRSSQSIASLNQFSMAQHIQQGPVAFRDATNFKAHAGNYQLSFLADSSALNFDYTWKFDDGTLAYSADPQRTVQATDFPIFKVTCESSYQGSCINSVTHYINVASDCDASFGLEMLGGTMAKVKFQKRIGSYQTLEWFLDSTQVYPTFTGELDLSVVPGASEITCRVLFQDNCSKLISRSLDSNIQNTCLTDFRYQKEKVRTYDPMQYATVVLDYYDENGKKFSTHYTDVEGDFNIQTINDYLQNAQGTATSQITFDTKATLKNSDGSILELKDCNGTLALGHP